MQRTPTGGAVRVRPGGWGLYFVRLISQFWAGVMVGDGANG